MLRLTALMPWQILIVKQDFCKSDIETLVSYHQATIVNIYSLNYRLKFDKTKLIIQKHAKIFENLE